MILPKQLPVYKTIIQCKFLLSTFMLTKNSRILLLIVHKLRPYAGSEYVDLYEALDNEYISVKTAESYVCFNKDYKAVELSYPMCRLMVENIGKGY